MVSAIEVALYFLSIVISWFKDRNLFNSKDLRGSKWGLTSRPDEAPSSAEQGVWHTFTEA
jgi:hypothetical protein